MFFHLKMTLDEFDSSFTGEESFRNFLKHA